MLDYLPCSSPAFSSFPGPAQKYPFAHQQPHYTPLPSTFTFDPFADDDADDASESSQSHASSRSERVEFLRQREWMRRVACWVDGVNSHAPAPTPTYGMTAQNFVPFPPSQPTYTPGPRHRRDTQPQNTHTPRMLYSTPAPSVRSYPSTAPSTPSPEPFDEPEPYVIYSTPLPGGCAATLPAPMKPVLAPAKKQPAPPAVPPRHVHSRVPSLDSIREEDEERL